MAEIRLARLEQGQTKIKNVPIAVTPEGFWCCPSPVVFQKTLNKPKPASLPPKILVETKPTPVADRKPRAAAVRDDDRKGNADTSGYGASEVVHRASRPKVEKMPRKIAIEFGEAGTSDIKVVLVGKQGFSVKLSVHKHVLMENSTFFAIKLSDHEDSSLEIGDCEDVEIYVETVGLMYCKEMKQWLMKQNVSRVLRILKVAECLGFKSCMQSCLEYLEAAPWIGDEEEEKVITSILRLQSEGIGVSPVLKRVSANVSKPHNDTLSHIIELVLRSNEERGRREMKLVVLRLLRENQNVPSHASSADICNEIIYSSCRSCLTSLLFLFQQAAETDFSDRKEPVVKQITLEADNLSWLLEILADRQAADEFAVMWSKHQELAALHGKLPVVSRYRVSCITARLFVGIGKGELLPAKDTRKLLLHTWLEPLINDYSWLRHSCGSFDRKVVEEGIGRTILTLPLEDQQSIMLTWLSSFLKVGDSCPNLQRAFEVWWRRTFVRPYVETQGSIHQQDCSIIPQCEP
ncbi:BTB/POZ domain-containing protein At3g50780-like [Cucurbita moschata]|uniref:BTB/POZ domain-containing protein At3g50780-like n=1 Tax=Cucurbita moschata TaxID=3662 RepID=A0A6J1GDH2_CUCMO|nr:BTB/POZ domain-containing protein At3g50780-like [Cucurbita moschata]